MTDYYVDPAAGGLNDGTSWINAWSGLQDANDGTNGTAPTAGDTVYCRGTETPTSEIVLSINGNSTSGRIHWCGCNALGVVDGTLYIVDATSTGAEGIDPTSVMYSRFSNIEVKNADNIGWAGEFYWTIFENCTSHHNGGPGFNNYNTGSRYNIWIRCQSYDNDGDGYIGATHETYFACLAKDNTEEGFRPRSQSVCLLCIAAGHTTAGKGGFTNNGYLSVINCVSDNNDEGIGYISADPTVIETRITNSGSYAFYNGTSGAWLMHSYLHDNAADFYLPLIINTFNDLDGTDTNKYEDDSDDGFVDSENYDFNLITGRTLTAQTADMMSLLFGS